VASGVNESAILESAILESLTIHLNRLIFVSCAARDGKSERARVSHSGRNYTCGGKRQTMMFPYEATLICGLVEANR